MIPKRLHLWWHDSRDRPDTWQWDALMPNWEVRYWYAEPEIRPAIERAQQQAELVDDDDLPRHYANVIRWHLLNEYGGVWVDCDVEPLAPLDPIIEEFDRAFCASLWGEAETCVVGGPAHAPLFERMTQRVGPAGDAPHVSGTYLFRATYPLIPGSLRLIRPGAFFERDAAGTLIADDGPRYTRHRWDTSSRMTVVTAPAGSILDP